MYSLAGIRKIVRLWYVRASNARWGGVQTISIFSATIVDPNQSILSYCDCVQLCTFRNMRDNVPVIKTKNYYEVEREKAFSRLYFLFIFVCSAHSSGS